MKTSSDDPNKIGAVAMFDKLIDKLPSILKVLTFRNAAALGVLSIIFLLTMIVWEGRVALLDKLMTSVVQNPMAVQITADGKTKEQVVALVRKTPLILGIQLLNIDIRSNTRQTVYFFSKRNDLQFAMDNAIETRVGPTPLFLTPPNQVACELSSNFACRNNNRTIEIMDGKLHCYKTEDTLLVMGGLEVTQIAPYTCSISIPPYEGKFVGYMNLLLQREPSKYELEDLASAARILASDIFDREIS